ncbi:MAG TPA: hypothetical protein VK862_01020 [Afifellaceae bacterium]|nr:hypothetical protein [Afifellaceae bacterium]
MSRSFGTYSRPTSTRWSAIRKGPSLSVVREHIRRAANMSAKA